MTPPVTNIEETIGKLVGRRRLSAQLRVQPGDVAQAEEWRRAFGGVRIPRGVHRFRSHQEADAWLMTMITRSRS